MAIFLHSEVPNFSFEKKKIIKDWLREVILSEESLVGDLNFIVVSDEELLRINQKFLKHDYYTDVITFNYNVKALISGDVYMSYERIVENALNFSIPVILELNRVMVHGLLHLIGYKDETKDQKEEIRSKENQYLAFL